LSSIVCLTPPGCCRYPSGMLSLPLRDVVATPPGCCRQPSGMLSRRLTVSVSGVAGSEATRDTRHPTLSRNRRPRPPAPEACQPLNRRYASGAAQVARAVPSPATDLQRPSRQAEKTRKAQRGPVAPHRGLSVSGQGNPPENPRRASTGLPVALRGHRCPILRRHRQRGDPAPCFRIVALEVHSTGFESGTESP